MLFIYVYKENKFSLYNFTFKYTYKYTYLNIRSGLRPDTFK